jgi:outer membrane protein OmpA-like peptidoglycan-associated protein
MRLGSLPGRRVLAVVVAGAGLLALSLAQDIPHRHGIEHDLTDRSTRALRSAGLSDVDVAFTGRDGTVRVGSSAEADRALAVVRAVEGVRVARAVVPAGPAASPSASPSAALAPPAVTLAVKGARVSLTGAVPAGAHAALVDAAAAVFGAGSVDDALTSQPGVADAGLSGLPDVLRALRGGATDATVQLRDGALTLTGTVSSAQVRDAAVAAAARAAGGASAVTDRLTVVAVQQQLVDLPPVTFLLGSATLTADGRAVVAHVADVLAANPAIRIRIEGHTDTNGTPQSNVVLSLARAQTVRDTLISLGVGADRMTAVGLGQAGLKVPDDTPANQAINRRVEFVVTG